MDAGVTVVRVEPEAVVNVSDAEHAQIVVRIGNGFHSEPEPLTLRLIREEQSKSRTCFSRTELPTLRQDGRMELLGRPAFLKAEFRDGRGGEMNLDRRLRARDLLQDLTRPIADLLSTPFDRGFVRFRRLVNTERDHPSNHELRPRVLLAEKPVEGVEPHHAVGASELGQEILERSSHSGQSAAEHVFRHGQHSF